MSQRKLVFEKYADPLGADFADREWPGALGLTNESDFSPEMLQNPEFQKHVGTALNDDEEDDIEMQENSQNKPPKGLTILSTPFGIVPLTDMNSPSKVFNLWLGHTNFRVSETVAKTIEAVDGIEILNVFSPYRFMVGFGKLFKAPYCMYNICKALKIENSKYSLNEPYQEKLDQVKQKAQKYNFWIIYVSPNGEISCVHSDIKSSTFEEQELIYKKTYDLVGGRLLTYDSIE